MNKKGSALLYVVLAVAVFSLIISYVITSIGNSNLSELSYMNQIIRIYNSEYDTSYNNMKEEYKIEEVLNEEDI